MALVHKMLDISGYCDDPCLPLDVFDTVHENKISLHAHNFYEMVYINRGFSMHVCDDVSTVLTSGDFFIIRPGQVHSYVNACETALYNCLFEKRVLDWVIKDLSVLPGLDRIFSSNNDMKWEKLCLNFNERNEVVLCLEKMKWEALNKNIGWQIKVKSLLAELLIFYSRLYDSKKKNEGGDSHLRYIHKALGYISENYSKDFLIKDMAENVGISADYLSKHFKNAIGVSPMEYLKNYRIAKTMEQLRVSDSSISDIASQIGFSDMSHFSRQFKQVTGVTPSDFRKSENINKI